MNFEDWTDEELIQRIKESLPKQDMPEMYDLFSPYGAGWQFVRPGDDILMLEMLLKGCPPSEIFVAYVEGILEQETSSRVKAHIEECDECAEEEKVLRRINETLEI